MRKKRTHVEAVIKAFELVKAGELLAHPDFLDTPFDIMLNITNGCGAAGKFDFVPDTLYGLWVGPNCIIHDHWYSVTSEWVDKNLADRQFLTNNLKAIEACSTWILKPFRRQRALHYYSAVVDGGSKAYWAGKERA